MRQRGPFYAATMQPSPGLLFSILAAYLWLGCMQVIMYEEADDG
jgi:hypothetical protein